jgi:hypothetical protein
MAFWKEYRLNSLFWSYSIWIMIKYTTWFWPGAGAGNQSRSQNFSIPALVKSCGSGSTTLMNTPRSYNSTGVNKPDNQWKTPGSQLNTPESQLNTPGSQFNTPGSQLNTLGSQLNTLGRQFNTLGSIIKRNNFSNSKKFTTLSRHLTGIGEVLMKGPRVKNLVTLSL